jgi:hypothetical protein
MRARLAQPTRNLRLNLQLNEPAHEKREKPPLPGVHEEVCVYLVRDGWRWKRVSALGKQVTGSDRAFDFRTDAFSDARQNNPGLTVRKSRPPPE